MNSCESNVQDSEIVKVIQGDENVIETILSFISRADRGIDYLPYWISLAYRNKTLLVQEQQSPERESDIGH